MITGRTSTGKRLVGKKEILSAAHVWPVAVTCDQCDVAVINGHICHESGCPSAWRDEPRDCRWCGCQFVPEARQQSYCDENCFRDAHGLPGGDDDEG